MLVQFESPRRNAVDVTLKCSLVRHSGCSTVSLFSHFTNHIYIYIYIYIYIPSSHKFILIQLKFQYKSILSAEGFLGEGELGRSCAWTNDIFFFFFFFCVCVNSYINPFPSLLAISTSLWFNGCAPTQQYSGDMPDNSRQKLTAKQLI